MVAIESVSLTYWSGGGQTSAGQAHWTSRTTSLDKLVGQTHKLIEQTGQTFSKALRSVEVGRAVNKSRSCGNYTSRNFYRTQRVRIKIGFKWFEMANSKAFLSHYQEMTPLRCTPLEGSIPSNTQWVCTTVSMCVASEWRAHVKSEHVKSTDHKNARFIRIACIIVHST